MYDVYIYISLTCVCNKIYMRIYIEGEREIERERKTLGIEQAICLRKWPDSFDAPDFKVST